MAGAETLGSVLLWGKVLRFVQLCFGTNHKRLRQLVEKEKILWRVESVSMTSRLLERLECIKMFYIRNDNKKFIYSFFHLSLFLSNAGCGLLRPCSFVSMFVSDIQISFCNFFIIVGRNHSFWKQT